MKELLYSTMILSLVFAVSCDDKGKDPEQEQEQEHPLLGIVSFKSDSTWTISNDTITQEWSDVVMASGCKKDGFNGGRPSSYRADCRQNNPGYGDLFSWRAVSENKDLLCPNDWRVPTREDFRDLDIAMGGNGELRPSWVDNFVENTYLNYSVWGGVGGGIYNNYDYGSPSNVFFYWSQTEANANRGFALSCITGSIHPQSDEDKDNGFQLRCVRNN
ncbi:MAG: fibrobacter succinogenes major paralogous domain-containing protein [Bacteroidales bacterium]|nr:fibrobacter succinogenes major paralogous domain-containing protein [Bacteroidales bacterium]